MSLELTHLSNSVKSLRDMLAVTEDESLMTRFDAVLQEAMRAGVIKNFEITYELSWKLMTRWLNTYISSGVADGVTKRQLLRLAAENRLIVDVDGWIAHHEARNKTAHIYDSDIAASVYRATLDFVHDARHLLSALQARND